MSEVSVAVCTVAIALFTFLLWRITERIAWFTGAMEGQSDKMMQLAARGNNEPVEIMVGPDD